MLYHTQWVLQAGFGPEITDVLYFLPNTDKMVEQKIFKTNIYYIGNKKNTLCLTTVIPMTPWIVNFM